MSIRTQTEKKWLPLPITLFVVALLFLATVCLCVAAYCRATPALNVDPYNFPLFHEYYPDLLLLAPRFAFFHSRQFFTVPGIPYLYPAPNSVVYEVFYRLAGRNLIPLFLLLSVTIYAVAGILFARALGRRGIPKTVSAVYIVLTLICCYPIWFELKQANIEIVTWLLIASGIALFLSGRSYTAAMCFCLAGTMKIYPVIFLGLLLQRRQYRQIGVGLVVFVLVTLLSTWLLCPDFRYCWQHVSAGVDQFRQLYMLRFRYETTMDHSLFATVKAFWQPLPRPDQVAHALNTYLLVVGGAGVVLWFARIRRQPIFNQVLALTIASILFPPTSFEYTLQHVLTPFALFIILLVDAARQGRPLPFAKAYLACFLVLLAAIPEVIHHGLREDGKIKSFVLLLLFVLSLSKSLFLPALPHEETHGLQWWETLSSTQHTV